MYSVHVNVNFNLTCTSTTSCSKSHKRGHLDIEDYSNYLAFILYVLMPHTNQVPGLPVIVVTTHTISGKYVDKINGHNCPFECSGCVKWSTVEADYSGVLAWLSYDTKYSEVELKVGREGGREGGRERGRGDREGVTKNVHSVSLLSPKILTHCYELEVKPVLSLIAAVLQHSGLLLMVVLGSHH